MDELWPYLLCAGASVIFITLIFLARSGEDESEHQPPDQHYQQTHTPQSFDPTLNPQTTNELPPQLRLDELDLLKVYNGLPSEQARDRLHRLVIAFSNLSREQQDVLLLTAQQFWRDQRPYSG